MEIKNLFNIAKQIFPDMEINKNIRAILIPHASLKYSGLAALIPFLQVDISGYSKIVCLCTNHYNKDNILVNNKNSNEELNAIEKEHSYLHTKQIIDFLYPKKDVVYYIVGNENTFEFPNMKGTLLITNSDLLHYGNRYGNSYKFKSNESQYRKVLLEEKLIYKLKIADVNINNELERVKPCGYKVLKLLVKYCNENKLFGNVCMYYDSTNNILDNNNILNLLKLDYKGSSNLVSYLSMTFTKGSNDLIISDRFEKLLLLSRIKSVVEHTVTKKPIEMNLIPKWCNINNLKNGVFVGIKDIISGDTRASIGYYKSNNFVEKTLRAAKGCAIDAKQRWKRPITDNQFDDIIYYMNILDEKSKWKEYNYESLLNSEASKDKKNYGYKFSFGGNGSTYLPGVWEENKDKWPQLIDMLLELIRKAYGYGNIVDINKILNLGDYWTYQTEYIEELIIKNISSSGELIIPKK